MGSYTTLKDVAKRAGTTAATVSYVLNDAKDRYISEDMRTRVLEAAKELNYVKSNVASSLKGDKRKMIAVLVPQFSNQFFTKMIMAIEEVADQYGYLLSIYDTFDNPKREKEIIKRMAQQRMDGYIIIPSREGSRNTAQLRELKIPMVVVDRPLEGSTGYPWVTTDNYQCGFKGASYLTDRGHRKIGFIGWNSGIKDLEAREKGFWHAVKRIRAEEEAASIDGEFSEEAGYEMTKRLLKERPDLTAVFYGYNIQARGGIKYLIEKNVDIGRELSVMLIGSPEWAVTGKNNFSHIVQHEYQLGKEAAVILFSIINGEQEMGPMDVIKECMIYEGDSVCDVGS
ncbi:substrate-binding domain-containing protein [Clostridium sp. MCC353]|uniref:LacI family DNA-binding transcriptional regulator n=1 Tax=Clostridium sp. MCC353 TaxID=2592646 RepID=UPI001C0100EA|nr:LacI family DNA-binding transcriptional regulator [Clostridium sp. MCC353]MBT9778775.1 substrate-binding domain-containing protein [Clostridium sp. MCC353]